MVTGAGWVSPGVAVRLGNGLGVLGASTTVTQSQGVSQIELADMNRDGLLDLVTASADVSTPDMVSCMLGVGTAPSVRGWTMRSVPPRASPSRT